MTQTKRTTAARKKPARKSPRAGSVLAWLFGIAAAGIASGVLLAVFVFAFIYRQLPPIDTLADYRPRVPLRVWSADGKLIGEFGEERRDFVRLSEVPDHVKHAILAAEDDGFYEHPGIEITGTFWYGGEASRENMDMLRPQVADADMIFAVGGGKAIDTCKVLAHETNRPFFTFPTIASTCASCTSLGIVYHPDGSLREYSFSKIPPNHIFINTEIIANAPARYLWAGMGDTMAKHYECTISSRNDVPAHSDAMGIALSSMCAAPILRWGKQAMADCEAHKVTPELTEIIEAIIISTGYVSNFVQVDYTTGMAHAMYNGFTILPSTEEYHHLHGEVVSYGILVMLTADKQYAERDRLLAFNRSIGLPTHLADIHARPEDLPAVTEKALAGIDVRVWPYPVAQQMLIDAVMELEQVG